MKKRGPWTEEDGWHHREYTGEWSDEKKNWESSILVLSNSNGILEISRFNLGEKKDLKKTETNAQIVQKQISLVPASMYKVSQKLNLIAYLWESGDRSTEWFQTLGKKLTGLRVFIKENCSVK